MFLLTNWILTKLIQMDTNWTEKEQGTMGVHDGFEVIATSHGEIKKASLQITTVPCQNSK